MRDLSARWKGCQTLMGVAGTMGSPVYTSPSYAIPSAPVVANDPYMLDAHGNYIDGTPISGGSGDDHI